MGFSSVGIMETVVSIFILHNACDKITDIWPSSFSFHCKFYFLRFSLIRYSRGKLYRQDFSLLFDGSFFSDSVFFSPSLTGTFGRVMYT